MTSGYGPTMTLERDNGGWLLWGGGGLLHQFCSDMNHNLPTPYSLLKRGSWTLLFNKFGFIT